MLLDRLGDGRRQWAGVADARGASVAHQIEAEGVERLLHASLGIVVGDDLGSRRQARFHPWPGAQPLLDGLLRQNAGAEHDAGIGCVGAARYGGDHDGSMAQRERLAIHLDLDAAMRVCLVLLLERDRRRGKLRLRRHGLCPFHRRRRGRRTGARELDRACLAEHRLCLVKRHAVLGPLGARQARLDRAQVELERVGEDRVGCIVRTEQSLRLAVRLDELHVMLAPPGEAQVLERLGVAGKEPDRCPVLRRHVPDGRAVGERQVRQPGAVKLDELSDDLLGAQHLRHSQHEVGRRRTSRQLAVQLEADHLGHEHRQRLAEHRRFCLDAADAPA